MSPFRNTLLHADCIKALPMLQDGSVNFILTDPPYITRYRARDGRAVPNDDNDQWLKPAFAEMYRVLTADSFCVSFYGWPKADLFMQAYRAAGFRVVGHLMFPKTYASSTRFLRYQHESAHLLAKGNPRQPLNPIPDVIEWKYTGNKLHPTQKPVEVLAPLIEAFSRRDAIVLDPFAGSGSTLVAALRAGRSYIGMEMDAQYHAIAGRRLRESILNYGLPLEEAAFPLPPNITPAFSDVLFLAVSVCPAAQYRHAAPRARGSER